MKNLFTILFGTIFFASYSQNPQVLSTSPISQTLSTTPNHSIAITFNVPIDPSSVNKDSFMTFGRWSGPMEGTYTFSNQNTTLTFNPERSFFYGESVTVRLTSSIKNANSETLTNGYALNYWTKTLPSTGNLVLANQFSSREPGESQIQSYGAYAGDVNDDEYSDLVIVNEITNDIRILLNDQNGSYDPSAMNSIKMPNASAPSTNEGADFNHDGMIDMAIGSTKNNNVSVFMGNTTSTFDPEKPYTAAKSVRGLAVIDINGDGWDDIATANRDDSSFSILVNDGTGSFSDPITTDLNVEGETSIVATDLNNDGIMDLAISAFNSRHVTTLINDGKGNFTQTSRVSVSGDPWMITAGDINADGHVDIVSSNTNGEVSVIAGDGDGGLSLLEEYPTGSFSLAIDLGDLDGDGDLDFISSNYGSKDFTYYENDGAGKFSNPVKFETTGAGSCAIFHDRNNDGAMDLTLIDEIDDIVILYENKPLLGVDDNTLNSQVTTYPNPFTEIIHLKGIPEGLFDFKLTDLKGRVVFEKENLEGRSIDTSQLGLANGTYIIEIKQQSKQVTRLVIKK